MAYVGNTPADKTLKLEKQQFTTSATTSYTLSHSVSDPQDIALFINNVRQNPNSAYTVSGTALTISEATASTDTMYCVFLGRAIGTVGIGAGDVTKDKLDLISDSTAGLTVKGDGGSNDGYLQLNCRVNSHGIKLKSPPHSAGATYTLTFPNSVTADKFLKTDGSGNLSFASAGISQTDEWALTSNFTGDAEPIASNLSRMTSARSYIGSGMTQSSGIFTFPVTGQWLIIFSACGYATASTDFWLPIIQRTTNNSSYSDHAIGDTNINHQGSFDNYCSGTAISTFDVTDTTQCKVRFTISDESNSTTTRSNSATARTSMLFIRLGDT